MLARASEAKTVSDVKNAPHRSGEKRVITGSASSIGLGIAKALAEAGMKE
jgi:NADP-dependent 3-hydroxy acid dehydrogenase YdfG